MRQELATSYPDEPKAKEKLKDGNLSGWAQQGVLLLNTALTVRAGQAGSHGKKGWEELTTACIKLVAKQDRPIMSVHCLEDRHFTD